ncbi:MAG: glycosyltransferase family 39 protein [Anaerolineae bacterium]|jgi:4-amino-4-deoxy-L-arabinose transferase-like glycosyltransferase
MDVWQRLRTWFAGDALASRHHRLLVLALILVALGLRLARLSFQPLWWDEGWSVYFASSELRTIFELTAVDIHPPLYYVLLHYWTQFLGSGVVAIRLFSVLTGLASIPCLYAVGRRLAGTTVGLLAALFLAVSPFHIYYSQEVRMYGLVTLLCLAAFFCALQWSGQGWRKGHWAGYVLAATAALYTQYYAGFVLVGLNLVVVVQWLRSQRRWRALLSWLGAQVAVALLYLPWIWYAGEKLLTYVRFKVSVEQYPSQSIWTYVARHLAAFSWGHAEGALAAWWWLGLLPLLLLLLALVVHFRQRNQEPAIDHAQPGETLWPTTLLVVALACGFAVNLLYPFNPPRSERLLLLALPAFLLLIAGGLRAVWRRHTGMGALPVTSFLALALVSLAFFYTVPRYPDDDYRPVAGRIRTLGLPSDAVVCIHPWQVGYFVAYLPDPDSRPALVLTPREVIPSERQVWADDPTLMAAELEALLAANGRIWFPDHQAMGRVLERQIDAYLVEQAYPVLSEWYGANTVLSFFANGAPAVQPVTSAFGSWLQLERAATSAELQASGWGIVAIELGWRLSEVPAEDYSVGLRLVGPTGHVWAQRDSQPLDGLRPFSEWPPGTLVPDRHGLLIPAGTPPGDYELALRVYRSRDLTVLPVTSESGSGSEVILGTVRVMRPETPPPVEALGFEQALLADFERLRLIGATTGDQASLLPGQMVEAELFWQAVVDPGEDFLPRLMLLDEQGAVLSELTEKPVAGTFPTAWWQAGDLIRDPHALPIAATVPPGDYRLAVSLVRAADGRVIATQNGQTVIDLSMVTVGDRVHVYEPSQPIYQQRVTFGSSVELTGYDLPHAVRAPDSTLDVTLYWHTLETPDRNYHVFVHLLDQDGDILAQHDGPPGRGTLPTLGWLPGEYLTDPHQIQIPADLPDGDYQLGVGLYEPTTAVRLGERAILDVPIRIQRSP